MVDDTENIFLLLSFGSGSDFIRPLETRESKCTDNVDCALPVASDISDDDMFLSERFCSML